MKRFFCKDETTNSSFSLKHDFDANLYSFSTYEIRESINIFGLFLLMKHFLVLYVVKTPV